MARREEDRSEITFRSPGMATKEQDVDLVSKPQNGSRPDLEKALPPRRHYHREGVTTFGCCEKANT